ncbi:MAG: hypothetical protein NTX25_01810 [Proteobacteria bacterium]|nr:hypothetical protein [Pseudomonadota bacterium]
MIYFFNSLLFLSCLGTVACTSIMAHTKSASFHFEESSQTCRDESGHEGLNAFDPAIIFDGFASTQKAVRIQGRDASCMNFSGVAFHNYIGVNYSVLEDWDFRGSDFTNAELQFNFIVNGKFKGSKLDAFKIGYGRVTAQDIEFNKGDMKLPKVKP